MVFRTSKDDADSLFSTNHEVDASTPHNFTSPQHKPTPSHNFDPPSARSSFGRSKKPIYVYDYSRDQIVRLEDGNTLFNQIGNHPCSTSYTFVQ